MRAGFFNGKPKWEFNLLPTAELVLLHDAKLSARCTEQISSELSCPSIMFSITGNMSAECNEGYMENERRESQGYISPLLLYSGLFLACYRLLLFCAVAVKD